MKVAAGFLTLLGVLIAAQPASAAPPNDNFVNALPLPGYTTSQTATNTAGATKETGETTYSLGTTTVWFTITPTAAGKLTIDTTGSDFNTVLAVSVGNAVNNLFNVAFNDDIAAGTNVQSRVTFDVFANSTYRIQVAGAGGTTGNLKLRATPPLDGQSNNTFAKAYGIVEMPFTTGTGNPYAKLSEDTSNFDTEAGELTTCRTSRSSQLSYIETAWFSIRSSIATQINVYAPPQIVNGVHVSDHDSAVAVYTGGALNSLTFVGCDYDGFQFQADAGKTYMIQAGRGVSWNSGPAGQFFIQFECRTAGGAALPCDVVAPGAAPATAATLTGTAGIAGWWRSNVNATLACTPSTGADCIYTKYKLDGGAWTDYSAGFAITGDGTHTLVRSSFATNGGLEFASTDVTIDATPPVVSATGTCQNTGANGWCNDTTRVITASASDASSGIASQTCTLDGGAVACGNITVGQGSHTACVSATDVAGNSAQACKTLKLDSNKPTTSVTGGCTVNGLNGWCKDATVTLTAAASDATSGIASQTCTLDGANAACGSVVVGQGTHTVCASATDNSGLLVSQQACKTVKVDNVAPTCTGSYSGTVGSNGWFKGTGSETLTFADAPSGLSSTQWSLDGGAVSNYSGPFAISGDSTGHVVLCTASDQAGNSATVAASNSPIKIDTTPPTGCTGSFSGPAGNNGWYTSNGFETLTGVDATSGAASITRSLDSGASTSYSAPFLIFGDLGGHTVTCTVTDNAGNVNASLVASNSPIKIDATAPTATVNGSCGVAGSNGWCKDATRNMWPTLGDNMSGWASLTCTLDNASVYCFPILGPFGPVWQNFQVGQGVHTLCATPGDVAGNVGAQVCQTLKLDNVAPTGCTGGASGTSGTNGWYKSSVSEFLVGVDATSGVASFTRSLDGGPATPYAVNVPVQIIGDSAAHTLTCTITDNAGNVSGPLVASNSPIKIDSTAPTGCTGSYSGTLGGNGWYKATGSETLTGTDALSGVASITRTLDGGGSTAYSGPFAIAGDSVGHPVGCTVTDNAGNSATVTASNSPIKIDTTPPASTVSGACALAGTNGWCRDASDTLTTSASDALSGVGSQICTLDGSPASCGSIDVGQGTHTVCDTATDAAGNAGALACKTLKLDNVAPTVTVNQAAGQSDPSLLSPILFTTVFSEPVASFALGGATVNGTAGGPLSASVTELAPNDGTTYSIAVSGMTTTGTVLAAVAANAAVDQAGNGNLLSTSVDNAVTWTVPVMPTISIVGTTVTEHAPSASADFLVTLSIPTDHDVTVSYATAAGTAAAGSDYATTSGTVTFLAGETQQSVHVDVVDDAMHEPTETFVVNLSGASGATLASAQATGTIVDDDSVPTVSVNSVSTPEGDAATTTDLVFTVALSNPTSTPVTVDWVTADGTATIADADYTAAGGTLTFAPGDVSKTVLVTAIGDTTREADETFTVALTNPSGAIGGTIAGTGTIANDDPLPAITIADQSVVEGDSGSSTATFTLTLSNPSDQAVTVDWTTTDATATAPVDYVAGSGTVTFAPGQIAQTVDVTIVGDVDEDGTETFTVNLTNPTAAAVARTTAAGTIADDDNPFVVNATADTDDGACTAAYCSLRDAIAAANARPGLDRIVFRMPGAGPFTIALVSSLPALTEGVILDGTTQPGYAGTPIVQISGGGDASLAGLIVGGTGSAVKGLIVSGFAGAAGVTLAGGGGHTLTHSAIGTDATGNVAAPNGIGVLVSSALNTVGGAAADGNVIAGNLDAGVSLIAGSNLVDGNWIGVGADGTTALGNGVGIRVEASDNTIGGTASGAGNLIANSVGAGVDVVDASPDRTRNRILANRFAGNRTIAIDLAGDGATLNDAGDVDSGPNLRQNVPVLTLATATGSSTVLYGTLDSRPDETYRIEIFSASVCGATDARLGSTTITTDGAGSASIGLTLPAVTIGDVLTATATDAAGNTSELSACQAVAARPTVSTSSGSAAESTGAVSIAVTLSQPSAETVTVDYSLGGGTATPGIDYVGAGGVLTFAPGMTTRSVVVPILDDAQQEPAETFTLTLAAPVHADLGAASATGTIVDDDPNRAPDCSPARPSLTELWPADHRLVSVDILHVTDPDGDPVTLQVTQILQDELTNNEGIAATSIDGSVTGPARVQLRAERGTPKPPPSNGRVYHVFFTATDPQGASCSGEVKVSSPSLQGVPAIDNGALYDSTIARVK